jgi:hypothetical protein
MSIRLDPRVPARPGVVDRLNATIKYREPFRPFAPVVPLDNVGHWFELSQPSPYMSVAVRATEHTKNKIPAVVHGNGTGRVQTAEAAARVHHRCAGSRRSGPGGGRDRGGGNAASVGGHHSDHLRDLFGYRWAFRCTTPASSDVVLGHGWAGQGYSATDIDPGTRGRRLAPR